MHSNEPSRPRKISDVSFLLPVYFVRDPVSTDGLNHNPITKRLYHGRQCIDAQATVAQKASGKCLRRDV